MLIDQVCWKINTMNAKVEDSNLTVALRIRPMSHSEVLRHATPIAHCVENNLVVLMDPVDDSDDILRQNRSREKHFVFDVVFDAKATQEDVYEKTCKVLIPSVIGGYNATVFAYGATGAGKTYTMLGADNNPGIMAQALTELFYEMKRRDDHIFSVTMSYLEIYNEMIRDLLNPRVGFLELREDHSGIQVVGLTEHSAKNTDEVMTILKHGNKQRTQEPTAANQTSSRSHAVLTISIRQRNHGQGLQQRIQLGKLYLIDLAGSERAANTKNRGKRMVEGAHINRSLLALGNCINALSDKSGQKYVNYRDSKLTRLLKDSLGGNCKTVMVAHISPASFHFEESRNTLVYADRAKHIKTKVRQNVVDMKMHISQYSNVISDLQKEIKRLRQKLNHQQESDRRSVQPFQGDKLEHSDEDPRLLKLKHELVSVFHDQIELRQSLTELNGKDSGICLKMTRLQLLIKRHVMQTDHRGAQEAGNETPDKKRVALFDVEQGQKELEALSRDKDRLDQLRNGLKKQLEKTNNRTAKLQEELSQLEICSEQREIVMLLARIQSLQMENARLNSAIVHQRAELYRCDFFLSLQDRCQGVSEELMRCQREVINENDFNSSRHLDYLRSVYKDEIRDCETYRGQLLPSIKKDQSLLSFVSADDGHLRNNNPLPKSLSPLPERRLFATNYTKHGISRDLEDLISLNSEFSTAVRSGADIYDVNDGRKSGASCMTPRTLDMEAEPDIVTHRTVERRKEMEQPRGSYRQRVSRHGERPSYYSDDKSPLTVSRMAHNQAASIASTSVSTAAEASTRFSQQALWKPKALGQDSLPEIGHDRDVHHRSRRKGVSNKNVPTRTSQKHVRQKASLPAVNYAGHRKFSLQPSIYNESDSSHAPSVMSEKAAILSRLNRHEVKGSIVATSNKAITDSIYDTQYRKMSVMPLYRKTPGLPEPSFALHH